MKQTNRSRRKKETVCQRCGITKEKGFYELGCKHWGKYFKRHMWIEEPTIKGKETAEDKIIRKFRERFGDGIRCKLSWGPIKTANEMKYFLRQSLKDYKRELMEDAVRVIDKYTSPAHPHAHSMRQLRLDSPRLKKMVDELKALADLSAE